MNEYPERLPLLLRVAIVVFLTGLGLLGWRNYEACRRQGVDGWDCVTHRLIR